MKRVIKECDACTVIGSNNCEVNTYRIYIDKEMDPSGNEYNTNWQYTEYCDDCYNNYTRRHPERRIQLWKD